MRKLVIVAALLTAVPALAQTSQNSQGSNSNSQGGNHYGAPGPVVGAGIPGLVILAGYGVYRLVRRRR